MLKQPMGARGAKIILEEGMEMLFQAWLTPEVLWSEQEREQGCEHNIATWPVVEPLVQLALTICGASDLLLFLPKLSRTFASAALHSDDCARRAVVLAMYDGRKGASQELGEELAGIPELPEAVFKGREQNMTIGAWFCRQVSSVLRRRRSQNARCTADVLHFVRAVLTVQSCSFNRHLPELLSSALLRGNRRRFELPDATRTAAITAALQAIVDAVSLWLDESVGRWRKDARNPEALISASTLKSVLSSADGALQKAQSECRLLLATALQALRPLGEFATLDRLLRGVPTSCVLSLLTLLRKLGLSSYINADWGALAEVTLEYEELDETEGEPDVRKAQLADVITAGANVAMILHLRLLQAPPAAEALAADELACFSPALEWLQSREALVDSACWASRALVNVASESESEEGFLNALDLIRNCCQLQDPTTSKPLLTLRGGGPSDSGPASEAGDAAVPWEAPVQLTRAIASTVHFLVTAMLHNPVQDLRVAALSTLQALERRLSEHASLDMLTRIFNSDVTPVKALLFQIALKRIQAAVAANATRPTPAAPNDPEHASAQESPARFDAHIGEQSSAPGEHSLGRDVADESQRDAPATPAHAPAAAEADAAQSAGGEDPAAHDSIWLSRHAANMVLEPLFKLIRTSKVKVGGALTVGKAESVLDSCETATASLSILRFLLLNGHGALPSAYEEDVVTWVRSKQLPQAGVPGLVVLLDEVTRQAADALQGANRPAQSLLGLEHVRMALEHVKEICNAP